MAYTGKIYLGVKKGNYSGAPTEGASAGGYMTKAFDLDTLEYTFAPSAFFTHCKVTGVDYCNLSNIRGSGNLEVQLFMNNDWYTVGYFTLSSPNSHVNAKQFILTSNQTTLNVLGSYTPTNIRYYVASGEFHNNVVSELTIDLIVTVDYAPSTLTLSSNSVDIGTAVDYTIGMAKSGMRHKIEWSLSNSGVETQTRPAGRTTGTYDLPESWLAQLPNSVYGKAEVVITTYYDDLGSEYSYIGTRAYTFTATVPASRIPTIEAITATIYNQRTGFEGIYIKALTGVTIQIVNAAVPEETNKNNVQYRFYSSTGESFSFDSTNLKYLISQLGASGDINFQVTVIDSRGRVSVPASVTINVRPYSKPAVQATSAYRCLYNGVSNENGTYATIRIVANCASIQDDDGNELNHLSMSSKYYKENDGTLIDGVDDMRSGVNYIIGSGDMAVEDGYYVEFTLTDTVGYTTKHTIRVETAAYAIHVQYGGQGVAFGKTSEQSDAVEINPSWTLYYRNQAIAPLIYRASLPTGNDSARQEGVICLIPRS